MQFTGRTMATVKQKYAAGKHKDKSLKKTLIVIA